MARHESPTPEDDSPLSSMASSGDEFPDNDDVLDIDVSMDDAPPPKRQKLIIGSAASSAIIKEHSADPDPIDNMSDVSSDTDGDVPNSPINARQDEEDYQEQVTVCAWEGCRAGDQGDMDKLVEHIHSEHIDTRAKKYTCEWIGCNRKGMAHASGYALKAHMRSHTREKPFYCYLPECDRAFTRSDALAKHMRTVHQTEDLRPSDPVSKAHQSAGSGPGKTSKMTRIILKTPQSYAAGQDDAGDDSSAKDDSEDMFTPITEDAGFTTEEIAMPVDKLARICKLQLKWSEKEGEELRAACQKWEEIYRKEWLEKEALMDQMVQVEQAWHERRKAIVSGAANVRVTPDMVPSGNAESLKTIETEDA
ncbi:putative zinc finger protein [Cladorrhinum sp. PSN259]|nr:putative zinc finger protein [Cladorrhinum sp. PSN259]